MPAETLLYIVIAFILFEYLLERILEYLNTQHWSSEIPEEMRDYIDHDKYLKARAYYQVKKRFGLISTTFSLAIILIMLLSGGFGIVDAWVRQYTTHPVLMALMFFGVLALANGILSLPFSIYDTFKIEAQFGFNKITPGLFIIDKLKGIVLGAAIGGGLLSLIIFFYQAAGGWFWLIAWAVVTAFSLFFTLFYTTLLVPLFNKLTPLEPGELRDAISRYAEQIKFPLKNIFVIDGSKRSTKSNAYFSGIGAKKTIVLYDTLVKNHSAEELVAVLAHEVGHYKKKHIRNSLILSIMQTGVLLFIFGQIVGNPALAQMMGAQEPSFHIGMLAFSLLFNPISLVIGILMNMYSRKNEFEADAFAKETYRSDKLQEALKKLSVDNLSNLRPHPAYVFFHYSHPPLLERLRALG